MLEGSSVNTAIVVSVAGIRMTMVLASCGCLDLNQVKVRSTNIKKPYKRLTNSYENALLAVS